MKFLNQKFDAVILAAGIGSRIKELSEIYPKGFININGKTLIQRSISNLIKIGVNNIFIVTGYKSEYYENLKSKNNKIITIYNSEYSKTGSFGSLLKLFGHIKRSFILLESDLLYEVKILQELVNDKKENLIITSQFTNSGDEVYVNSDNNLLLKDMKKNVKIIGPRTTEFTGISKISFSLFNHLVLNYSNKKEKEYEEVLVQAASKTKIFVKKIDDIIWCEIDTLDHLKRAIDNIIPQLDR